MARFEARVACAVLLQRFSDMRLATERPAFKDNLALRGLKTLPIAAKR